MVMQVLEATRPIRRWAVFLRSILFVILCAVILAAVSPLSANLPERWSSLTIGVAAGLGAFALTIIFVRWDGMRLRDAGAAFQFRSVSRLAIGFLIGLGLVLAYSLSITFGGHVHFVRAGGLNSGTVILMLSGFLALSCREELAFHGYALRSLDSGFGLWTAQLVIALLFAVEHVIGGVSWTHSIFGAALGSLLFGMAALATRGLAVPIGIHAAWNFGQWALGEKNSPGIWKMSINAGFERQTEMAASLCYAVLMLGAMAAFWGLWRRTTREKLRAIAAGR